MKSALTLSIIVLATITFMFSCQRQLHFDELPADASLEKDAAGNCKPAIIGGTYKKGKNLVDTNFIIVEVNVVTSGAYSLTTDTVNGYSFSAKGNFDNTGSITVKMQAHGKPINTGNDQFNVRLNASVCSLVIPVVEGNIGSFSFLGAPNKCTGAVVSGNYIKGVQLTNVNTATVQVYVTSPGTFSFSSNLVNGYQFSASGYLNDYGNQTITLTASGSPANVGVDVFTLNAGFSACNIVDTVKDALPTGGMNHFPLSHNSKWVYDDLASVGDSIVRMFVDSSIVNGNLYQIMHEKTRFGEGDYHFRRDVNTYYDQGSVDRYTGAVTFSPPVLDDILFLKEGLNNNDAWLSPTYTGVATFGQTILIRYSFLCTTSNASVTVNGRLFDQVYEIQLRPQIASVGGPYGPTGEVYDLYYANNIGLIYMKEVVNGFAQKEWQLRSWKVY